VTCAQPGAGHGATAHWHRGAENSLYHQQLLEIGEAWRAAQGGNARFVVFTDGSQGGEAEISRRMRIGQLQGGLLSVVGLREMEPTVAALQNLPLLFRNWKNWTYVRDKMRPAMEKRFQERGLRRSSPGAMPAGCASSRACRRSGPTTTSD